MWPHAEWHQAHCDAYKSEIAVYQMYAETLEKILKVACRLYAPLGIVQVRPKSFASYAEKMARKAAKYSSLGIGPTDLCGARVITETQQEVEAVCAWIREVFEVDELNSVDVRTRLKAMEFGYRSVHYVVQLKGTELLGVEIPASIGDRKAEIQVRTLLEHAWASISHDRVYKAGFAVPDRLARDLGRVAAILEQADAQFGDAVQALDRYKIHYGVYMDDARLTEEIEVLTSVLEREPEPSRKPAAALRLSRLSRAAGDWTRVEALLAPYVGMPGEFRPELLAEHGHALCRLHAERPSEAPFVQGQAEIDQAVQAGQGAVLVRALEYRAWASARVPDNEQESRAQYRAAFEADPENPFHLASHLEYELYCGECLTPVAVSRPTITQAIATCRAYADAGIELPWAFLTMGRLHLLLDEPYESLAAYARAIRFCLAKDSPAPVSELEAELVFLRRINRGCAMSPSHTWVKQLLELGLAMRGSGAAGSGTGGLEFREPVVILAGGTSAQAQPLIDSVQQAVQTAFDKFTGTIISGGTTVGVPRLAGELAQMQRGSGAIVLGYVPKSLPVGQTLDSRYTRHVVGQQPEHGPGAPLHYWADLLQAGVRPADVKLVGIDGGRIAGFEYRLALALGAQVGLFGPLERAAGLLRNDPDWRGESGLFVLPKDGTVLRAFVRRPAPGLDSAGVEAMARKIHETFLAENRHKSLDPAMKPWEDLAEDLRVSNRSQAASAIDFLQYAGYRVERADGTADPIVFDDSRIDTLAELEHGRWVVERLQSGWRFGEKRDPAKRVSPYLVAWADLPDQVKDWDRNAVRAWPQMLAQVGLRVIKL